MAEGVGVAVAEGVGVAVAEGETIGFGAGSLTPLLQTNFLPLFTHVYLKPLDVLVRPDFLQASPGLTALEAGERFVSRTQLAISMVARLRLMS
ncbi:MAG: hypothetical protein EBR75_01715 [Actinobacteria bacterium]|nr:hypothetical protein [Actinomycetota bacterium]